jgi:HEAT repeat protein
MSKTTMMQTGVLILAGWIVPMVAVGDSTLMDPWLGDLSSGLPAVRRQAAVQLGRLGDRAAVPPLIELLQDAESSVRREAARALGELKDKRAVPGLIEALADEDANVRNFAAYALGEIRDPRAADALLDALADPQWTVRDQAAWALRELRDPSLGPRLADLLARPRTDDKAVVWLLQQMEPEHSLPIFAGLLKASEAPVRLHAVRALAATDDAQRLEFLRSVLDDCEPAVRLAAVEALAATADQRVREVLQERWAAENDAAVARVLRETIDRLSPLRHLAAWWSFDDRNTEIARDVTGNGNDGRIRGCQPVEGRSGAGLQFGPGRYIELGQPPNLPIANQPFTIMAWAQSATDEGVVAARGGAFCGFSLYLKDGVAKFGIQRLQDQPGFIAAGDQRVVGRWVHLAGVVHEDRIELFVDGRLSATTKTDGYIPSNCGQGMEIGFDLGNSPAEITTPFQGVLDEVKFFHAALSAQDVAEVKE